MDQQPPGTQAQPNKQVVLARQQRDEARRERDTAIEERNRVIKERDWLALPARAKVAERIAVWKGRKGQ